MSSQPPKPPAHPPLTSSPYPFAAAPDIIRAHQKDAYFQGLLANQISDLQRRWLGARSAHAWASEARTAGDLLYHCLTTLLGNRTLGEEYCDLVQVEAPTPLDPFLPPPPTESNDEGAPILPALPRRAGYIATSILLPYLFGRVMPGIRSSLRARLQARLTTLAKSNTNKKHPHAYTKSTSYRLQRYILTHLTDLTSGAHFQAIVLAIFYFTGAYYSLSKRLFGLRYVFTKRMDDHLPGGGSGAGGRAGYEVLGVLLLIQMLVRGWIHARAQLNASSTGVLNEEEAGVEALIRERAFGSSASINDVSLDENAYSSNNSLLGGGGSIQPGQRGLIEIGQTTHTPVMKGGRARYDLSLPATAGGKGNGKEDKIMGWIKGYQQRKCTLCLDEMKDPAATSCGHVFCWTCIGDWVREKPECPLCRREALVQHILPLRAASA
ncbi:Pex2 / Pex12 amino terminal region domain containing protein [Naviculisporaceae sp. PSN 640]